MKTETGEQLPSSKAMDFIVGDMGVGSGKSSLYWGLGICPRNSFLITTFKSVDFGVFWYQEHSTSWWLTKGIQGRRYQKISHQFAEISWVALGASGDKLSPKSSLWPCLCSYPSINMTHEKFLTKEVCIAADTTITTILWPSEFCPRLPGWAGTRMVKPIWISLKQETVSDSLLLYHAMNTVKARKENKKDNCTTCSNYS